MSFVPCSPRHKHCSPSHADLVRSYIEERQRQEQMYEEITGLYSGDMQRFSENHRPLITFAEWMKGHRR